MQTKPALNELFDRRINYPDFVPQERLARLIGLDNQKSRLETLFNTRSSSWNAVGG